MSQSLRPNLLTHGEFVGGYEIRRLVGRGRHAEVYVACHPVARREVAVKVFSPPSPVDGGFALCFQEEAEALIALRHPNMARILEAGVQASACYLVMVFVEGMSLRDRLAAYPVGLGRDQTLRLFAQIASAVASAHDASLAHGNLMAENILISTTGRPVVTECSLASLRESLATTSRGNGTGASVYNAPELISGAAPTPASDIFSLGMLLHEMVTGDVPLHRAAHNSTASRATSAAPVISQVDLNLDPRFDRVIFAALRADPAERCASVRDMLAELQREDFRVEYEAVSLERRALPDPPRRASAVTPLDHGPVGVPGDDSALALVPHRTSPIIYMLGIVIVAVLFALVLLSLM